MVILIDIILLAALVAALVKPEKVLPFINANNTIRRLIAVAAYACCWVILAVCFGPQKLPERIATPYDEENNKKWETHAATDSLHMADGYFSADSAKSTLELAARYTELAAIVKLADYKKDEITDSTIIYFANRNSNTALEMMAALQPSYRARYAQLMKEEMWEHDIDVRTLNKGTTIEFVGGIFASNKNIKEFQNKVRGSLKAYGFKRSQYRWYKYDDEYTYYDLE